MKIVRILTTTFTLATMIYAFKNKRTHGTFLMVPFDFRAPTIGRIKSRWWNPNDRRIFTPHVFGVGWSVNVYQVLKKLGVIGNSRD
ncbi:MAG: DUF5808 domain-containing protein [Chloroflexi bacterium]|nr:DUF5808 domain-containing protein [Chloroflexota bacterium]